MKKDFPQLFEPEIDYHLLLKLPRCLIQWGEILDGMLIFSEDETGIIYVDRLLKTCKYHKEVEGWHWYHDSGPPNHMDSWSFGKSFSETYFQLDFHSLLNPTSSMMENDVPKCCGQNMDWIACALKCQVCWKVI